MNTLFQVLFPYLRMRFRTSENISNFENVCVKTIQVKLLHQILIYCRSKILKSLEENGR